MIDPPGLGDREGNIHERMGKSDLGAIDGTISRGFDEGKEVVVAGVEGESL